MIVSKLQIRPRSKRFRFSNAEILGLDTVGAVQLVAPPPAGFALELREVRCLINLVQVYTDIAAAADNPFLEVQADFNSSGYLEDTTGGIAAFSRFFGTQVNPSFPMNSVMLSNGLLIAETVFKDCDGFTNLGVGGFGILMQFTNNGSDLTGGDPANFMDILVDYNIVKVTL